MGYSDTVTPEILEQVLQLLKDEADMDGVAIVPMYYLGDKLGYHKDTMGGAVAALVRQKLITRLDSNTKHGVSTLQIIDF